MKKLMSIFGAAGLSAMLLTAPAQAQVYDDFGYYDDYYDYYNVGYDTSYDDDWFYDYYEYDAGLVDDDYGYDYYSNYDYDTDVFDWEEDGLFE